VAKPAFVAALVIAIGFGSAEAAEAPGFELTGAKVSPRKALYDGVTPVAVRFRFSAESASDVSIRFRRRGRIVRRLYLSDLEPGFHRVAWDGSMPSGKAAPEGAYRAFVKPVGGPGSTAGRFVLHHHAFPVPGRHGMRGALGEFGAPRSGGRVHEGFDVVAACGKRMVAARGGRVVRRGFDPVLYGNFLLIKGRKTPRNYFYSHLRKPATVGLKARVRTGQTIGRVGDTGNARGTGCHLHFEVRRRGRPIDPEPELRRWDRWS